MNKIKIENNAKPGNHFGEGHLFPEFIDQEEMEYNSRKICADLDKFFRFQTDYFDFTGVVYCKNNCGVYIYSKHKFKYSIFKFQSNVDYDNVLIFDMVGCILLRTLVEIESSTCNELIIKNII